MALLIARVTDEEAADQAQAYINAIGLARLAWKYDTCELPLLQSLPFRSESKEGF